MRLLTFPDLASAQAANAAALAYLRASDPLVGEQWSNIFTDGTRFGLIFDGCIQGAFDDATLGRSGDPEDPSLGNVIDGDPALWSLWATLTAAPTTP